MEEARMIAELARGRVAVVGDVMLDHYVFGEIDRISPEAPVPVLHVARERHVLGGAANVAANIAALGGAVRLIGVIGDDGPGAEVNAQLAAMSRISAALAVTSARPTIQKTRYISGQQQIVRVDREVLGPLPEEATQALIAAIERAAQDCGCIVLSDYGKGVLHDRVIAAAMAAARAAGAVVIVDPKRKRLADYTGAHFITPNRKELTEATGLVCTEDAEAAAAAARAMAESGAAILLTRSERGMSLFQAGKAPIHLKAQAREVFDVSGAGDTVVASFGLGLASGLPVESAMRIANVAAGIVVGKLGTATCTGEELLAVMQREANRQGREELATAAQGVTPLAEAVKLREAWGRRGLSVGFANGCFDLLHPGHVSLLRQAAAACDRLIVAINSDASVRALKGPSRPIQNQEARAEVLNGLKGVDAVIVFDEPTPLEAVTALQPDLIVKGADYREEDVVGGDIVKARGGRVLLAALKEGHSTTAIVKRSAAGD